MRCFAIGAHTGDTIRVFEAEGWKVHRVGEVTPGDCLDIEWAHYYPTHFAPEPRSRSEEET